MLKKILILCACATLTACGSNTEEKNTSRFDAAGTLSNGGIFVSASIGEASNLIPWTTGDASSHAVSGRIYRGMLKYDKNLNLVPDMAQSFSISADNLSITFKLNQDITWTDGKPFTAHDVMASYNTMVDDNTRTPYSGDYKLVTKAEVLDDYTFKVHYSEPFAPALSSWTLAILPKHMLDGQDINDSTLKESPVGSGAYMLKKWKRGEEIVLESNPSFNEGEAPITTLRTRLIPDVDTQFLELKAGNIDTMGLKPLQFTRLTNSAQFTNRYAKYKYLSNGYTYMGFNLKNPLFASKEVRQALSYAIPRDEIIQGVLMGQGLPMAGVFKPGTWPYNDALKPYPFNATKAKEMLTQEGWTDSNNDGILDKKINGVLTAFEFTVVTNQGNDLRKMTAELMQRYFSEVGVKMNINVQEWSSFIQNTINKRQFDAFILGWSLSPEPDPYDIWHSSKTKPSEFNIVGFSNKKADELMEKARRTFNQEERKIYLDEFQEILHDQQPYLFLYAPYSLSTVHKRVKGIEEAPAGIGHNQEKWYIPESQRIRPSISQ